MAALTARIKALHDARLNKEMEIRSIYTVSQEKGEDDEVRGMRAEDEAKVNTLDAEIRGLNESITALIEAEERSDAIDGKLKDFDSPAGSDVRAAAEQAEDDVRKWIMGEAGTPRALELTRPDSEKRTVTALYTGANSQGAYTIPRSFYSQLQDFLIVNSAILSAGAKVINTNGGNPFDVPIVTTHSTATLTAEASAIGESEPAFGKRTLGAYKYAFLMQISRELVEDTGVDLLGFLAEQAGVACGNALGADLTIGDGSAKPAGIVGSSTLGVTGATSVVGVPSADNLIDLYYSVIAPYRNNAVWLMNDSTMAKIRKLKSTTNEYLFQPALTAGTPDVLIGKAIHTDPNIAATATSAKSILFGDLSKYWARIAAPIRFERSDEFAFNLDLITFRATVRGDGILVDQTGAVKYFVGGAS